MWRLAAQGYDREQAKRWAQDWKVKGWSVRIRKSRFHKGYNVEVEAGRNDNIVIGFPTEKGK